MSEMNNKAIVEKFNGLQTERGYEFVAEVFSAGENQLVYVTDDDLVDFPVAVSVDENRVLCLVNVVKKQEVDQDRFADFADFCLSMNALLPLSAFTRVGDYYALYGELSVASSMDMLVEEIEALLGNVEGLIDELKAFTV